MPDNTLVETDDGNFHVGERWNYKTRAGEEGSTVTIVKVQSSQTFGVIVCVRVDGLRMVSPRAPGGAFEGIAHMPFAQASIDESITSRDAVGVPVPTESDDAYEQWRTSFDAGTAGIWTITVAEAVELTAQPLG